AGGAARSYLLRGVAGPPPFWRKEVAADGAVHRGLVRRAARAGRVDHRWNPLAQEAPDPTATRPWVVGREDVLEALELLVAQLVEPVPVRVAEEHALHGLTVVGIVRARGGTWTIAPESAPSANSSRPSTATRTSTRAPTGRCRWRASGRCASGSPTSWRRGASRPDGCRGVRRSRRVRGRRWRGCSAPTRPKSLSPATRLRG